MNPILRRFLISLPLLGVVAIASTALLLHLDREAWIASGVSPALWDWKYTMMDGNLLFAVAQYLAAAGALALAWISWNCRWRPQRYILLAWGLTWLPVVLIATGDVMASSAGPFNFPMSMFAAPLFAFFCLVEAGIIILLHRYSMSWSPKVNLTAQKLKDK